MKYLIVICIVAIASVAATYNDEYATSNVRSDIREDGSYSYGYDTSNGISAQESGVGGVSAQGRASWTAPDGTPVQFSYVADENGYRAEGPFVPATPPHVIRLLEFLRTHPQHEDTNDYFRYNQQQKPKAVIRPVAPTFQPFQPFKPFTQQKPVRRFGF